MCGRFSLTTSLDALLPRLRGELPAGLADHYAPRPQVRPGEPNGATIAVHDRMPAIIDPKDFKRWLDSDNVSAVEAAKMLKPAADDALEFFEIGSGINKATSEGADLQARLDEALP